MALPCLSTLGLGTVAAAELSAALATVKNVGPKAEGHREAAAAWQELSRASAEQLPELLAALDDATPLSANWIRAAVDAVAERQLAQQRQLPQAALEKFVLDTAHAPLGRRLAFEWLSKVDQTAADRLIPGMLHDPSVEFRRDAVTRLIDQAKPLAAAKEATEAERAEAIGLYRQALSGARDLDQIDDLAKTLKELKQTVDLPLHFGFLTTWRLIGPFDNTGGKGYPLVYPPETTLDFEMAYQGKTDTVRWFDHTTTDEKGMVDLNKAIAKHMGAVGYAATVFVSDKPQVAEIRWGCINANKVWLNGQLIGEHEVYHANTKIDQYKARVTLQQGKNVILLKCCQNEQTDNWAQNWQFQLRVCDAVGTAILSADRPAEAAAAQVLPMPPAAQPGK